MSFFEFLFEKMRSSEIERIVNTKKYSENDEDDDDFVDESKGHRAIVPSFVDMNRF